MDFCTRCNSKLVKTTIGLKCSKCDDLSQIPKEKVKKIGVLSKESFPFEKDQYYESRDIRNILYCDKQSGISYNREFNFLTLIRYAHELKPNPSNPYLDHYDKELKKFYYVGKGTTGDQTLTGVNKKLAKSKENNTSIHLFWQHIPKQKHQYVGQMSLEKFEPKDQLDKDGQQRIVYVFTLKPIQN